METTLEKAGMKVVVLLSSYNGEKYIEEQIDSILRQEGVEISLLCRDDGSSDSTPDILRRYADKFPERVSLLLNDGNLGFVKSFGRLIAEALKLYPDASLFAFADQDDVWLPDKVAVGAAAVSGSDRNIPVAYCCRTRLVDTDLNDLPQGVGACDKDCTRHRALIQNIATGCTMVFNRRAARLYVENPLNECKVHDLTMFQMCVFLGKMIYDPQPHILYRQHASNQIGMPDFRGRMKNRLKGRFKEHYYENNARNFLNAFRKYLSKEDIRLLESFVNYRRSLLGRLRLAFNPRIRYDSAERNFFFVLKVLMGTV